MISMKRVKGIGCSRVEAGSMTVDPRSGLEVMT